MILNIRKRMDEPRDKWLSIRVSQTEKAKLAELADSVGVSVGAYLVGLALGNGFVDGSADIGGGIPDPAQVTFRGF